VASRPEIGLARKFNNVDDNKHAPFCHPSRLFCPIGSASSHTFSSSEHWPVYKICNRTGIYRYARKHVAGDDIPQDVLLQLQMSVKNIILCSRKSIKDEAVPTTYLLAVAGGDKLKAPDRLSSTEADGGNRRNAFRQ